MVFLSKYLVVLNSTPSSQWSEAVRGLARARRRSTDCWKHRLAWGPAEQSLFRSLPSTFPLSPALSLISHSSIFSYVVWFSSSSLTNHLFFSLRRHLKPLFLFLFWRPASSIRASVVLKTEQITNCFNSEQRPCAKFLLGLWGDLWGNRACILSIRIVSFRLPSGV